MTMPRKIVRGGRRFPVSLRVTEDLRDQLGAAASAAGRSMAQEIEFRLEQSLSDDRSFGGPALARIAFLMAAEFAIHQPNVEDPIEFRSAMNRVIAGLLDIAPGDPMEHAKWTIEAIKSHVLTRRAQKAMAKQEPEQQGEAA
jgi:Arc-like DNA binding domain